MFKAGADLCPLEKRVFLSSPTMHGEEKEFVDKAIYDNWVTTAGENIDALEAMAAEYAGTKYAVALSSGTAALHLCVKLAGVQRGDRVFCSDMTFDATVNPVLYEGGMPVFIDTEYDTWNMDPASLEKAFRTYPDVKVVVLAHLYGVPAKMDEILEICRKHGAVLVEDAAEAFGAFYIDAGGKKKMCGSLGDYNAVSTNGNKIITGSSGGLFLTDSKKDAEKVRKWATQAREAAPWYQHEELGYNYRMSNIVAGIARGNMLHITEHIEEKKHIYERYRDAFRNLPVSLNPYDKEKSVPNYWLSCLLIRKEAMCRQVRGEKEALYIGEKGKSCPTEILERLEEINAEGRPIWKPMHMQPLYRSCPFIAGNHGSADKNAEVKDASADIYERGLCLPSDNKMTEREQDRIIEVVKRCFG